MSEKLTIVSYGTYLLAERTTSMASSLEHQSFEWLEEVTSVLQYLRSYLVVVTDKPTKASVIG